MTLHETIRQQLSQQLLSESEDPVRDLNNSLRLLSKWRSVLIQNTILRDVGTVVQQGPLEGLDFVRSSSEGCHIAKLIGCYEQPLQPHIYRAIETRYDAVINIGCAEGYYAVGLAIKMPHAKSYAYDIDTAAQEACAALAEKNDVQDRVIISGRFEPSTLSQFAGQNVLIICDIEGEEETLLDPIKNPGLREADIIVESHECLRKGVTGSLRERFKATHEIIQVDDNGSRTLQNVPPWFHRMEHLDQLLATWEWRSGPTPWLVMKCKTSSK